MAIFKAKKKLGSGRIWGFRGFLITILILFSTIPLLLLSSTVSYVLTDQLEQIIIEGKQNLALAAARDVDNFIRSIQNAVEVFAAEAGRNFEDLEAQRQALENLRRVYPQMQYIFVINGQGRVQNVVPTEGWRVWDFNDREWYKQVVSTGQPYISDSYISDATHEPMAFIAYPIFDAQGKLLGVVGTDLELKYISQTLDSYKTGETGYAFVIDKQGITLAHPDRNKVINQEKFEKELTKEVLSGKSGIGEYDLNGVEKIAAYAPVESAGWGVFFIQDRSEVMAAEVKSFRIVGMFLVLIVALAALVGYVMAGRIANPFRKLVAAADGLANGDFTQDIPEEGLLEARQLAASFKQMQSQLSEFIQQVRASAQHVAASSEELAKAAEEVGVSAQQVTQTVEEIAKGAQEQAEHTGDVKKQVEDAAAYIQEVNRDIQEIYNRANQARKEAEKGRQQAQQSVSQMEIISAKVNDSAKAIKGLEELSGKISDIVKLITGIAEQTNLLALNAAIEAARAGEQGRGFAVVAEEVRKLAEGSAKAAGQIAELIKKVQQETKYCVEVMSQSTAEVSSGAEIIIEAGKSFAGITALVDELEEKIKNVAANSKKVVEMVRQAEEKVESIAAIGEQAAASTEEVASSAEEQSASLEEIVGSVDELAKMAQDLQRQVQVFKILE